MVKKTKAAGLETLDIKAKKKKNFIVVIIIIVVFAVLGISIGSAFLDVKKEKLYRHNTAVAEDKQLNVIQNPEFKETWAISIENRLDDQNKRLSEVIAELSAKQTRMLTEIKKELRDGNQKKSDEIAELGSVMDKKFKSLLDKVNNKLDETSDEMDQFKIMAESFQNKVSSAENEVIVGPDLLPRQPRQEYQQIPVPGEKSPIETPNNKVPLVVVTPDKLDETKVIIEKPEEEVVTIALKKPDLKKLDRSATYNALDEEVAKSETYAKTTYEKAIPAKVTKSKPASQKKNIKFSNIDTSFNETIVAEAIRMDTEAVQEEEDELTNGFHISTGLTQVYMVTGAYAPAFSDSDAEPLPVLMSTQGQIVMSNNNVGSVEKCFILGSAKGNMNSETADIRLVSISCLLDGGKYRIEGSISGWVIGENGIPGVPGELLHKNGAWIAKTFVAGFLETFSQALVVSSGPQISFGGQGTTGGQTVSTGESIGSNALSSGAGGVSTVFNQLGEYYLKMAEQIFPVIEVKGGRTVDVLLMGGEDLTIVENNKVDIAVMEDFIEQEKNRKKGGKVSMSKNAFTQAIADGSSDSSDMGSGEFGEAEPSLDNASLDEFDISE